MEGLYLQQIDAFVRWHRTAGSGPPVVWLPGLCFPAAGNFLATVTDPALGAWSAVMIDFPGSGASDRPKGFDYGMAAHADCVAAVMDRLGLSDCPVVGFSAGGTVAVELAVRRPDLVARLVVAEGNLSPGGGAATRAIAAVQRAEFIARGYRQFMRDRRARALEGKAFDAFMYAAWRQADPAALHATSMALVNLAEDFEARFLALKIPRTFIYGERTHPEGAGRVTPDTPDPARLRASGVRTAVLPGTGHDLMVTDPRGFARLVAEALGTGAPGSRRATFA